MRKFVMGDIHGAYRALQQCLEKVDFDISNDILIQLGDVTDGHNEVYQCVELLLTIKNLILIRGNHDHWFHQFIETGLHPQYWLQGGKATAASYLNACNKPFDATHTTEGYNILISPTDIPPKHVEFFHSQQLYYVDNNNNCFVHGGFNRNLPFREQDPEDYFWDRNLWKSAMSFEATKKGRKDAHFKMVTRFHEVFIGHTSTLNWKTDKPIREANIYNLDTGAGHYGRLTIMEIETKKWWQSDPIPVLYAGSASYD